jgi:hypothetical protein
MRRHEDEMLMRSMLMGGLRRALGGNLHALYKYLKKIGGIGRGSALAYHQHKEQPLKAPKTPRSFTNFYPESLFLLVTVR